MAETRPAEHPAGTRGRERWLWIGFLGPPLAFLTNLGVAYPLVPATCRGDASWALHLTAAATLAVALYAGARAWREWSAAGRHWPGERADAESHVRFMGALGSLGAALFSALIVAQWLAMVIVPQCRR